jgi:hypothetical protein
LWLRQKKLAKTDLKSVLFSGAEYFLQGGNDNFIGDFDILDESTFALFKEFGVSSPDEIGEGMWAHIYDSEKREIV